MAKKKPTKAEKFHMAKVASLGCIACYNLGYYDSPPELHHVNAHGTALRASDYDVIPLCHAHHRTGGYGVAVHAGKAKWEIKHGTELELLEQVKGML